MKTDKELADHLDAQHRLRKRGYRQKSCPHCKGLGLHVMKGERNGEEIAISYPCLTCKGIGTVWEAPMT